MTPRQSFWRGVSQHIMATSQNQIIERLIHCLTLSRRDPKTGKFTMEKAPLYHIVDEKKNEAS